MIQWNKVTWYSKLLAVIFFIGVLPVWTFYIGVKYTETKNNERISTLDKTKFDENQEFLTFSYNSCPDESTAGMSDCAWDAFTVSDKNMTYKYNEIMSYYDSVIIRNDNDTPAQSSLKESLIKSQKAWLTYRDSWCEYISGISAYTKDGLMFTGSISKVEYPNCLNNITEDRIKKLSNPH